MYRGWDIVVLVDLALDFAKDALTTLEASNLPCKAILVSAGIESFDSTMFPFTLITSSVHKLCKRGNYLRFGLNMSPWFQTAGCS